MTKTFFLGLGGQKCGSSWIQAYLARQKGSDFGRLGEYQIWEHEVGGVFARYRAPEPPRLQKIRALTKRALGAPEPVAHLRWRLQADPQTYFQYFARILSRPGIQRTGDITPSYAALPAGTLTRIRDGMASHAQVKAIFSMRDPVDRIRSHMRMEMAKGRFAQSPDNDASLRAFYASAEAAARTRYDLTLDALDQVFAPEDTHLSLFETLFTATGTADLAHFAEVAVDPQAGAHAVNARDKGGAVPEDLAAEIARHYAPVYRAVSRRLPQIEEVWPSARFALSGA